jgi:hypothetical protein
MRIVDRDGTLVVQDSPALHWFLGLLFAVAGALFVLEPLWLFTDRARVSWPVRALSVFMGGAGLAAGVWVLNRSPRSTFEVDRRVDRVWIRRRGLNGAETRSWPIQDVEGARLSESMDDENGQVFRVEVVLRHGDVVPISLLWTHGRGPAEAVVRRLQEALVMPRPREAG